MSLEPVLAGLPAATRPLDDVSKAWLDGLQAAGAEHDRSIAELHDLLLRVARYETSRRSTSFRPAPTLVIWGQGDIFYTPEGGEAYLRDLPDAMASTH